jgi:hypothetical protein
MLLLTRPPAPLPQWYGISKIRDRRHIWPRTRLIANGAAAEVHLGASVDDKLLGRQLGCEHIGVLMRLRKTKW